MTAMLALVADIGGTHNRWQLIDCRRGVLAPLATQVLRNDAYPAFSAALAAALTALGKPALTRMVIAAAGPAVGNRIVLTNRSDWVIDGSALAATFGCPVTLVNDFAAQAYGVLTARTAECERLDCPATGTCPTPGERPLAVIGPGTGLGIAFLWQLAGETPLVLASEAGNLRLPPLPPLAEHWPGLVGDAPHRQPFWEWILSGPGLLRLHWLRTKTASERPESIVDAALHDRAAAATVAAFAELLAAFAAEAVLMTWATAGVVLVGSLANAIAPWLRTPAWHAAFTAGPRYRRELAATPRWLIHATDLGLRGAAWLACQEAAAPSGFDQSADMGPS